MLTKKSGVYAIHFFLTDAVWLFSIEFAETREADWYLQPVDHLRADNCQCATVVANIRINAFILAAM